MKLSRSMITRLGTLQHAFLNETLDAPRVESHLAEIGDIVAARAAFAAWLEDGAPALVRWNARPQIDAYMAQTFAGIDRDGNIRCTDPDLDEINCRRRQMGTGVYHETAFAPREMVERARFHREAFAPAGLSHVIGMTARLSVGEAIFAFGFASGEDPGFTDGETEQVLTLLLPAFEAGFLAIDRRDRHRDRIEQAIAASPLPAQILSGNEPPAPETLLSIPLPEASGEARLLSVASMDADGMAGYLAERHGLTSRQRQVAALILTGIPTRDIATRLDIAHNTARRHCEAVLQKIGAGRRARLAELARQGKPAQG